MDFIKFYVSLFSLKLSPNASRVLCGLLRYTNTSNDYANVSMKKIALALGISVESVQSGIRELQQKRVVTVIYRSYRGRRLANGYKITKQSGRFIKVPISLLGAPVTASGFLIMLYMLKCADKAKRAFPSLTSIAAAIGVTVKTVIRQIKELQELGLLSKANHIKRNGSFGHNQYRLPEIIKAFFSGKSKRTRTKGASPQEAEHTTYQSSDSMCLKSLLVKAFRKFFSFFRRGTVIFRKQVPDPS